MQIKTKNILTMLVVAGISIAAIPAKAASFVAGDVLLGFQASGGTGSTTNVIVDLGPATALRDDFTNGTSVASLASIGAVLTSTYGSNWATRSDLSWGAVANRIADGIGSSVVNGDPKGANYVTIAQSITNPGTQMSSAPTESGKTSGQAISGDIQSLNSTFSNASGTQGGSIAIDSSTGTTWSSQITDNNFKLGTPIQATGGIASSGLDLYRILSTVTGASPTGPAFTGTYQGTFTVNSAGTVGFTTTATAAPEPSRALLAALGLGGLLLRRRRQLKA
jgi:MYXO-CTERM domain-containing protein